jgi:hypothetical protein
MSEHHHGDDVPTHLLISDTKMAAMATEEGREREREREREKKHHVPRKRLLLILRSWEIGV